MATRKNPPGNSRSRRGPRTPATLDPAGTRAPPHNDPVPPQAQVEGESRGGGATGSPIRGFGTGGYGQGGFGGGLNTGALNTQMLNEPGSPPSVQTPIQPPSAGTFPVISSAISGPQPPPPDPAAVTGQPVVSGYDSLNVSEPTFRTFDRGVVTLHVRGLIDAFQEIEEYHPKRNVPAPPLWKDDKDYLDDIKALTRELRRLNDLLEEGKAPDAAEVKKSESAIVHAATKISDAAYDTIGKGIGAAILMSVGLLAYGLGASPDVVQIILAGIKGGK